MVFDEGKVDHNNDAQVSVSPFVEGGATAAKIESKEQKEFFLAMAEKSEVTVKRADGCIEGGWRILFNNPTSEGGKIVENMKGTKKPVSGKTLAKWQPFHINDPVPVIRSSGKLDANGWTILNKLEDGKFEVGKKEDGKSIIKKINKSALIKAEIASLNAEKEYNNTIRGQSSSGRHPDDGKVTDRIDADIKYWQDKLNTINELAESFAKYAAEQPKPNSTIETEDDQDIFVVGQTPEE